MFCAFGGSRSHLRPPPLAFLSFTSLVIVFEDPVQDGSAGLGVVWGDEDIPVSFADDAEFPDHEV